MHKTITQTSGPSANIHQIFVITHSIEENFKVVLFANKTTYIDTHLWPLIWDQVPVASVIRGNVPYNSTFSFIFYLF